MKYGVIGALVLGALMMQSALASGTIEADIAAFENTQASSSKACTNMIAMMQKVTSSDFRGTIDYKSRIYSIEAIAARQCASLVMAELPSPSAGSLPLQFPFMIRIEACKWLDAHRASMGSDAREESDEACK